MSKHYPGPWSIGGIEDGRFGIDAVSSGHWRFAQVVAQLENDEQVRKEFVANARLISAAPDLLDALGLLLNVVDDAIRMGDWKVDGRCDPDSAISYARKTMQKATGD